ncbi:membrane protein [Mycobacterium terramassiliense]|uniref:Membrane protein n=2 Tax=Mycobacterium terramassiliense TaxID=1841859 RepID=A0A2U3NC95_9MYCO|nr:membrane protein [Mycobacterium terramassiliense]
MAWRTGAAENEAKQDVRVGPGRREQPDYRAGGQRQQADSPEVESRRGRPDARSAERRLMPKIPITAAAKKFWIVLVIVAVVAVAGFCVYRLRGIFGVHGDHPITSGMADDIKPFNPKHVVYEVYGPPGTTANINYLDINAQPQKASNVPLPWTLSVITTLPSVSVNVVAQGDSDQIGCRIVVNDVVKDERSSNGVRAQTFCIVKSA